MDFFETQERYRRREMRGWMLLLLRIFIIGGALWLGWLWGRAEQISLQAEADLVIYENNQQITQLSDQLQDMQMQVAEAKATGTANLVTGDSRVDMRRVITKQLAVGVSSEQIVQSIQSLGKPLNCRVVQTNDVAVATPFYAGPESKLVLFGGGLNLFIEGSAGKKSQQSQPWFDPAQPVTIRHAFLGGQKMLSGILPLETVIPAEDWVLKLRFAKADLLGYVTVVIQSCTLR